MTPDSAGLLDVLSPEHRTQLLALAREVGIPAGVVIFEEDDAADRFWILCEGRVALDFQVPGRGSAVVETIGPGDLLGWSWLVEPFRWQLGARARTDVTAYEFDTSAVFGLIERDLAFGLALTMKVAATIGQRLRATRARLIDMYDPKSVEPVANGDAW